MFKKLSFFVFLSAVCLSASAFAADVDGDGVDDLVLWQNGKFTVRNTRTSAFTEITAQTGMGQQPVVADFDGDGRADTGVYLRTLGQWKLLQTRNGSKTVTFGEIGALAVPRDYDGDGLADLATFLPATANWRIRFSSNSSETQISLGSVGSVPVPIDLDCDRKADLAAYDRATSRWYWRKSTNASVTQFFFGLNGDIPLAGGFLGNGCEQAAVYRPTTNFYYVAGAASGGQTASVVLSGQWGLNGDTVFRSNTDGGAEDFSVYRAADFKAYARGVSTTALRQLGFNALVQQSRRISLAGAGISNQQLEDLLILSDPSIKDLIDRGLVNVTQLSLDLEDELPTEILPLNIAQPVSALTPLNLKVRGDYSRSHRSHLVFVQQEGVALAWTVFAEDSYGRLGSSLMLYGDASDQPIPGDYDGDGRTETAIYHVRSDGQAEWKNRNTEGAQRVVAWGLKGDQPLAGTDLDGDGTDDQVIVRSEGGFLRWYVNGSTGYQNPSGLTFGLNGDKAFAADLNGSGSDNIIVARNVNGGKFWYSTKLKSPNSNPTALQWGLSGDTALRPADMDGDGINDYIVVRLEGGGLSWYIRLANGSMRQVRFGLSGDIPMTGYFSGVENAEIAIYRASQGTVYVMRHNGAVSTLKVGAENGDLVRPDGTSGQGAIQMLGAFRCDQTLNMADGTEGRLWKPVSDSNGRTVLLLPAIYYYSNGVEQVLALKNDGTVLDRMPFDTIANGFRAHYRGSKTARALKNAGGTPLTLYVDMGFKTQCFIVPDPVKRAD